MTSNRPSNYDSIMDGAANMLYEVGKKMLVILRDDRVFIGILCTTDQYANLVLKNSFERFYVGNRYAEVDRGLVVIRGENVSLAAEMKPEPENLVKVPLAVILEEQRVEQEEKDSKLKKLKQEMKEHGKELTFYDDCVPNKEYID